MIGLAELGADDDHVGAVSPVNRHGVKGQGGAVVIALGAGAAAAALGVVVGH